MKRHLTGLVAALAALTTVTAPAAARRTGRLTGRAPQDGDVTMTIGLIQDMSSPNVTVGYLVAGVRGVEPAVRHAHRQGGRRLRHDPRPRRVVGGVRGRADLHLHAA